MEFRMPALNSPQDVLAYELKAIDSAERQLSRALPRIMKKLSSDQLREMLEKRLEQGATLMEEIDGVLEELEAPKARPRNAAAEGLIAQATDLLEEAQDKSLVDPLVLGSVQKLEHYCIAAWGTAAALARMLEQKKAAKAMERALKEGKRLDDKLTELAESEINPTMMKGTGEAEEGEEKAEGEAQRRGRSGGSRRRTSGRSGASARNGKAR
jgi:ferritin-like metal-binding protein YciE